MTARALPEDGPSNAPPRVLRFAGGPVDTSAMPASHPGGVTRTTVSTPEQRADSVAGIMQDELADAVAFLDDARKLIAKGRLEEADFERSQAVRHIKNALLWGER